MKEAAVERYLVQEVEKRGGLCEKFVSPGRRSVPDRIVTWPYGVVHFVELKAPGKEPRADQLRDHARRAALGVNVFVIDSKAGVDLFCSW
jgi:hypothetical protein